MKCIACSENFNTSADYKKHYTDTHLFKPDINISSYPCLKCKLVFTKYKLLIKHAQSAHGFALSERSIFKLEKWGFKKLLLELVHNNHKYTDAKAYFHFLRHHIKRELDYLMLNHNQKRIRFQLCLKVNLEKDKINIDENGEYEILPEYASPIFCSFMMLLMSPRDSHFKIDEGYDKILKSLDAYLRKGSGWQIKDIHSLLIKISKYRPYKGGHIKKLPLQLALKKAIVNIKSDDEKCFLWCILAALYPDKQHPERFAKYQKYESKLNTKMLSYPVKLSQISAFEKSNTIRINVMGFEEPIIVPMRLTKLNEGPIINLLLHDKHFFLIKNIDRLLSKNGINKKHFCLRCCQGFRSISAHNRHTVMCEDHQPATVILPNNAEALLKFNEYQKTMRCPYVAYFDFESVLKKITNVFPNPNQSSSTSYEKHEACSFAYVIIDYYGDVIAHECRRSEDAAYDLIIALKDKANKLLSIEEIEPIRMSKKDKRNYRNSKKCYMCKYKFQNVSEKVRDHDHHGKSFNYRGAACISCNHILQDPRQMPCIAHCLKSYDGHYIIKALNRINAEKINVIPLSMEKYTTFTVDNLLFLDSYQFLSASLSSLAMNLDEDAMHCTKWYFNKNYKLMSKKGYFPYEYLDDFSKFDVKGRPARKLFSSTLNNTTLTTEEYKHVKKVWKTFKCETLGDYHDLYLRVDCLLLADIFENFRKLSFTNFGLDPVHYFSLAMYAWSATLKLTRVELELLTDYDMHLFIEKGIRGGISCSSKRYAKANNLYLEDYNSTEPTSYIAYWDCNALYATAMCEPMPTGSFKWLDELEIDMFDVTVIPQNSDIGFILEVDLKYPKKLHNIHNDYPLCPEHLEINGDMLSDVQKKQLLDIYEKKPEKYKSRKLSANLYNKKKYIVHYRNLQYYIQAGLKLKKIHRILSFKQKAWLKPYIDFNINKRINAKNNFEKDFYKLANNAVFGKTMENQRDRAKIEIVTCEKRCKKLLSKPNISTFHILEKDLAILRLRKWTAYLNKPIYTGFVVLDLSKLIMCNFFYDVLKRKYTNDDLRLLYTDTDSFIFQVFTEDLYKDMSKMHEYLDTSDYPENHYLHSMQNKKVLGKFKDEANGLVISEFVGLKSKMYSILYENTKSCCVAKGIKKDVVKNSFRHQTYIESLTKTKKDFVTQHQIISKMHDIYSVRTRKMSLHPFDDKRYILDDGLSTLAHGHYNI